MSKPARGKPGESRPRLQMSVESIVPPGESAESATGPKEETSAATGSVHVPEQESRPRFEAKAQTPEVPAAPPAQGRADAPVTTRAALEAEEGVRNVTVGLNPTQQARAKMAVVKTGPFGGPASFSEFIRDAIDLYLDKLSVEFNDGTPFEPYHQPLKRGRPFS
jgi:hypothetical protein